MGEKLILRPDIRVFDVGYQFPQLDGLIGVSLSAGVESTILLHILLKTYGKSNVRAFSGLMKGRRSWEAEKARAMVQRQGALYHFTIDDNFVSMSPDENARLAKHAKETIGVSAWFNGAADLLYHPTFKTEQDAERLREKAVFIPFIGLQKSNVIDLYFKYNVSHLLPITHSCTDRGDVHCGKCVCCLERARGFIDLGIRDPATYSCEWSQVVRNVAAAQTVR